MWGREVDGRSDLFSLGVLLYELLTARSPFRAATPGATIARVRSHRQPPATKLNPRVDVTPSGAAVLLGNEQKTALKAVATSIVSSKVMHLFSELSSPV